MHPDLVLLAGRAICISDVDFAAIEGARTVERQMELIKQGASSLKDPYKSRHVIDESGFAYALDVAALINGEVRWDWPLYQKIARAFKRASSELAIPVEWGGDWRSFKDGPHFQLPHKTHPRVKP